MMQRTEMNHLLNMLTLAPRAEASPGGQCQSGTQEADFSRNCLCLRLGCLIGSNFTVKATAVTQKMKHNKKYLSTFGEDNLLPLPSHFSALNRYK